MLFFGMSSSEGPLVVLMRRKAVKYMYSGCSDKKGGSVVSGSKANDKTQEFVGEFSLPSPRCSSFIKGEFIEYIPGKSLTLAFPVLEDYLNPAQTMQGGIITAAFDNKSVSGPCSLESKTGSTALLISTPHNRPDGRGCADLTASNAGTNLHSHVGRPHSRNKRCNPPPSIWCDPQPSSHPATQLS